MSEAKHTLGKWMHGWETTTSGLTGPRCAPSAYWSHADIPVQIPIHNGSRPIAWVLSSLPDDRANSDARLIAAAPELLEAALLYIKWCEAEEDHSKADFYERMQMCRDAEDATRAAIAKATGEQK